VDDVEINLDVAKGMMEPYGMTIACVLSGEEVLDLIRRENPRYNTVFMDHMMPGLDGIETVRIMREEIENAYAKNIPVIALTANAVSGTQELFLKKGFQDFLSKPIDILRLDEVIRRWIMRRRCPPST
jgi:CheY-like chemotaxis protein